MFTQHNSRGDVPGVVDVTPGLFAVRAVRNTNVSVLDNTVTIITLPVLGFDSTGTQYDATNDRIVVAEDGIYEVNARIQFAFSATGLRRVQFKINGANTNMVRIMDATAAGSTGVLTLCFIQTGLFEGDYLELEVVQNSGGPLNLSFAHLAIAMIK